MQSKQLSFWHLSVVKSFILLPVNTGFRLPLVLSELNRVDHRKDLHVAGFVIPLFLNVKQALHANATSIWDTNLTSTFRLTCGVHALRTNISGHVSLALDKSYQELKTTLHYPPCTTKSNSTQSEFFLVNCWVCNEEILFYSTVPSIGWHVKLTPVGCPVTTTAKLCLNTDFRAQKLYTAVVFSTC